MTTTFQVLRIAKVCHEANRALCESFGDNSQKTWDNAEEWQRESACKGVEFTLTQPDAGDRAQHDAWCVDKYTDGWRYGPVKDAEAKTHPCLVDFDRLPPEQQAKDRIFRAIVNSMR